MGKYNINFSCGHTETVGLFGKNEEREKKIKYFEKSGFCKECYKEMKQEQELENPKIMLRLILDISRASKPDPLKLLLEGETRYHREEIKSLGFKFNGIDWERYASFVEGQELVAAIKTKFNPRVFDKASTNELIKFKEAKEQAEKFAKERDELILKLDKPVRPEKLSGKWNGKFYGSKGAHCIYIDNEKIELTNEEKEEIETYVVKKAEYDAQVNSVVEL